MNVEALSRAELLTFLSILEGELEAQDVVIHALRVSPHVTLARPAHWCGFKHTLQPAQGMSSGGGGCKQEAEEAAKLQRQSRSGVTAAQDTLIQQFTCLASVQSQFGPVDWDT